VFLKKGFKGAKSGKHNKRDAALSCFKYKKYCQLYCRCKNTLSATGTSYAWDLDNSGGAADSTLQNPSCTYNNKIDGGTYPPYAVRLTVTDSDGDVGAITKTSYISVCYSDVNVIGSSSTYTTMQSAYNAAKDSSTIQSRAVTITENVNFNLPKTITITGGYNCDHSVNTGNTVISGNMTISNGNVTIGNVYLQ